MTPFRTYQETGKGRWPGKAITITKSKTDYSSVVSEHPDDALNNEYVATPGSQDLDRPLCMALHSGAVCKRPVRRGTRYCYLGRG